MNLNTNELLAALAAGLIAGVILAFIEKQWPASHVGRV